ncbi:MAG TPA: aldo/keto reductase [Phycisphaerae bacterium]|nr:aldo/keto reductase [Phycisphaerae bacterium]
MEHRKLGTSDLELPVITFGAWGIGGLFWGGSDDDEGIRAIQAAIDHGVDAIDTAPMYGCGHSESLVGKAIKGRRDRVRILTKCGLRWDSTEGEFYFTIKAPDGRDVCVYKNTKAASIRHECEQSLTRLGVETIDLYQVHWPSASAPAEETMGALVRLKEEGKIRHIGMCNYRAADLAEALRFGPVVSDQIKYNLLEREIESDPLPFCRRENLGVLCYSPMALGLLTGKVTMDRTFPETDIRGRMPWYQPTNRRRVLDALEKIRPIADAHGATLAQVAVAWVLTRQGVTTALVGARNARQAVENAAAAGLRLSEQELAVIGWTFEAIGKPAC